MLNDTIAAISTAAVDGAISIIRMSGTDALSIADSILNFNIKEKKAIRSAMVMYMIRSTMS